MTPHPKVAMAAVLATTDRSPVAAPSPPDAVPEAGPPFGHPERAEARALPRPANDCPSTLGLRAPVLAAIAQEARKGNIKVILWLAARLNCVTAEGRTPANDDLTALLRGLSADELRDFARLGEAERRR